MSTLKLAITSTNPRKFITYFRKKTSLSIPVILNKIANGEVIFEVINYDTDQAINFKNVFLELDQMGAEVKIFNQNGHRLETLDLSSLDDLIQFNLNMDKEWDEFSPKN